MLQGPRMNARGMQPHHFMGPGYMGPPAMHPRQMYPNQFGQRPGMQQGQFGPMMGRNPQSRQGGGGLLSKLLGKGGRSGQRNAIPGFSSQGSGTARAASSGGGILKTLADPAAINGFLNNTQQVLKTAQQFGPMIQQYGPLVRNLPSIWKLYKGLKNLPDAEDQSEQVDIEVKEETASAEQDVMSTTPAKAKRKPAARKSAAKKQSPKGSSSPKLFY